MPRASFVVGALALCAAFIPVSASAASVPAAQTVTRAEGGAELIAANEGGAYTIVAIINYQSAAGRVLRERLADFAQDYPDIKIAVRPVPGGGPLAEFLAKAAYAAARQGRFLAFHDAALGAPQAHTWYSLRDNAPLLGLDWPRFQQDFQNPAAAEAVQANVKFAEEVRATSTPAIIAAGRVFAGPLETSSFAEIAAAARGGGAVQAVGAK